MLFLAFMSLDNFLDWFDHGGFFLCAIPFIFVIVGFALYQIGKEAGRKGR